MSKAFIPWFWFKTKFLSLCYWWYYLQHQRHIHSIWVMHTLKEISTCNELDSCNHEHKTCIFIPIPPKGLSDFLAVRAITSSVVNKSPSIIDISSKSNTGIMRPHMVHFQYFNTSRHGPTPMHHRMHLQSTVPMVCHQDQFLQTHHTDSIKICKKQHLLTLL